MGRRKMLYIGSMFIVMVIVTVTYFSYAFLIKNEEHHGKLNVVVGTLDYKITSDDLTNNQITVAPGKKEITITLKSLNTINSKYQLYYQAPTGVVVGYTDTNLSTGTLNSNEEKEITLMINNTTESNQTVTFGVEGGFSNNTITLSQGTAITEQIRTCTYTPGQEFVFSYNGTTGTDGSEQIFNPECDGTYKLEVWGAQGGSVNNYHGVTTTGGYGGYSVGNITLSTDETLYINVGGNGILSNSGSGTTTAGGYNGGGNNVQYEYGLGATGGGATHIATVSGLLKDLSNYKDTGGENISNEILIVAGGGGSGGIELTGERYMLAGHGGGISGSNGQPVNCNGSGCPTDGGVGGSQTDGNAFGQGANGSSWGGSGGAGWYGGKRSAGGGGGSGYIGSTNLSNKYMYCYNCTESTATATYTVKTNGTSSLRDTTNCPNGYSSNPISKCAKVGNGNAKITYLGV